MQVELSETALKILLIATQIAEVRERANGLKGSFPYLIAEIENANAAFVELKGQMEYALVGWKPSEQERESIKVLFPGGTNYSTDGGLPLEFQYR